MSLLQEMETHGLAKNPFNDVLIGLDQLDDQQKMIIAEYLLKDLLIDGFKCHIKFTGEKCHLG